MLQMRLLHGYMIIVDICSNVLLQDKTIMFLSKIPISYRIICQNLNFCPWYRFHTELFVRILSLPLKIPSNIIYLKFALCTLVLLITVCAGLGGWGRGGRGGGGGGADIHLKKNIIMLKWSIPLQEFFASNSLIQQTIAKGLSFSCSHNLEWRSRSFEMV